MRCRSPFRLILPMLLALTTGATGCLDDPELSASSDPGAIEASSDGTTRPLAIVGVAAARSVTTTDDQQHLVYELVLQNTSATSVEISRVVVVDPQRHRAIARYQDAALAGILRIFPDADQGARTIPPGGAAIAFFDLALTHRQHLPHGLAHRITVQQDGGAAVVAAPTVAVIEDHAPSLAPPLRGDRILALGGGCCDAYHRRAFLGTDEGVFLAQRFAIDFVRVDDRATFAGDPTKNASYFLFGAEVVAVGSGRIVAASDGMAENIPTEPLPPFDIQTAPGNHVVEELDDGRFVVYAHLHTGSVRVQAGERVRRGQVLGLVGNTGNSNEPHLHFHVADRASPFSSNGLPYAFDRFRLMGTIDASVTPPVLRPAPPPQQRRDRLPLELDVVAFP